MTQVQFISYCKQVANNIKTNDLDRLFSSYYLNLDTVKKTIAALGGLDAVKSFVAANISKTENELFYL